MRDSTISSRVIKISLSVIATHSLKYKVTRNFFFPINASTWLSLSIEDSACGLLHASMTHGDTSARIWTPDSHLHTWFWYEFRIGNIFNSCTNDELLRIYLTFFHIWLYDCERESWECDKEKRGSKYLLTKRLEDFDPHSWRSQVFDNCAQLGSTYLY